MNVASEEHLRSLPKSLNIFESEDVTKLTDATDNILMTLLSIAILNLVTSQRSKNLRLVGNDLNCYAMMDQQTLC